MVQAWYQGGLSVFDWTDPKHPKEIAYFDRGPWDPTKLELGGFWSTYWYNGYIYGSEILWGFDIFELKPSGLFSQNEIDAAKSVHQLERSRGWMPARSPPRATSSRMRRAAAQRRNDRRSLLGWSRNWTRP
jgi:hypothetical protein